MSKEQSDKPPDDALPTYEEALHDNEEVLPGYSRPEPATGASRPQVRPQAPPRPTNGGTTSESRPSKPQKPQTTSITTHGNKLPWRYPPGYHCSKCNNTGYKRSDKPCRRCWRQFSKPAAPPVMGGAPPPMMGIAPPPMGYPPSQMGFLPPAMGYGPPMGINPAIPPLVVQPGDPRLGGRLCYECGGSGRVRFLFDVDLCALCRGTGRIR